MSHLFFKSVIETPDEEFKKKTNEIFAYGSRHQSVIPDFDPVLLPKSIKVGEGRDRRGWRGGSFGGLFCPNFIPPQLNPFYTHAPTMY